MQDLKIGLIGLGGIGGVHFGAYQNIPGARVTAIVDVDGQKLQGDTSASKLNIGGGGALDLSGVETFSSVEAMLQSADIDAVDICLPTPLHAENAIAALRAGKHVMCEKPIARSLEDAQNLRDEAEKSGKILMIGHCLRFWPAYVETAKIIENGEFGRVLYAHFHRSSGTPKWSHEDWLRNGQKSGGALLDMHIHDIDTAIWWFGRPDSIGASGLVTDGLTKFVDASWSYKNGPQVYLHGGWDDNAAQFRMAFRVVLERASVVYDSSQGGKLSLWENDEEKVIPTDETSAYQLELEEFVRCARAGEKPTRVTPQGSVETLEVTMEEMRLLGVA